MIQNLISLVIMMTYLVQPKLQNQNSQYSFVQTGMMTKDGQKGLTEEQAQKIIEAQFLKLDQELQDQHVEVMEQLNNSTDEQMKLFNESVYNMTVIMDKMVYHMDKRLSRLDDQLQDNIRQTEELSFLVVQDQLDKSKAELQQVMQRLNELKQEMAPLSGLCDQYFSCSECQTNNKCGWCSMEERCVLGDKDGPLYVSCNFYNYKYCAGKDCSKYNNCGSCLSDPSCGWCYDDQLLASGCLEQPADYRGCPAQGWFHIEGQLNRCPKYADNLDNMNDDDDLIDQIKDDQIENWARQPDDAKQNNNAVSIQDELLYQQEKNRVMEERQKEIESVTPEEKRRIFKIKQEEYVSLQKRVKDLKAKIKQQQERYDTLAQSLQQQGIVDEIESDEVEEENLSEEEQSQ